MLTLVMFTLDLFPLPWFVDSFLWMIKVLKIPFSPLSCPLPMLSQRPKFKGVQTTKDHTNSRTEIVSLTWYFWQFFFCLNTCLRHVDICTPSLKTYWYFIWIPVCLVCWKHVDSMFEDLYVSYFETILSCVWGHTYPMLI